MNSDVAYVHVCLTDLCLRPVASQWRPTRRRHHCKREWRRWLKWRLISRGIMCVILKFQQYLFCIRSESHPRGTHLKRKDSPPLNLKSKLISVVKAKLEWCSWFPHLFGLWHGLRVCDGSMLRYDRLSVLLIAILTDLTHPIAERERER